MLKEIGNCGVCHDPIFCAPGQIVRFHRMCRKEGRLKFGRSTGVSELEVNEFGKLVPKIIVE